MAREIETALRNQYFALQHGADQSIYVPSSTSDLYNFTAVGRQETQPYPGIAAQYTFENKIHSNYKAQIWLPCPSALNITVGAVAPVYVNVT